MVWCLYCVISLGIIALVTLLSLGWAAADWKGRRRAPGPAEETAGG
jgi:hypothetical protein